MNEIYFIFIFLVFITVITTFIWNLITNKFKSRLLSIALSVLIISSTLIGGGIIGFYLHMVSYPKYQTYGNLILWISLSMVLLLAVSLILASLLQQIYQNKVS